MPENNHPVPPLTRLVRKALATGFGALENRGELFMVEVQEERRRLILLVLLGVGASFLAMVGVLLLTGTILFLFPSITGRMWPAASRSSTSPVAWARCSRFGCCSKKRPFRNPLPNSGKTVNCWMSSDDRA